MTAEDLFTLSFACEPNRGETEKAADTVKVDRVASNPLHNSSKLDRLYKSTDSERGAHSSTGSETDRSHTEPAVRRMFWRSSSKSTESKDEMVIRSPRILAASPSKSRKKRYSTLKGRYRKRQTSGSCPELDVQPDALSKKKSISQKIFDTFKKD